MNIESYYKEMADRNISDMPTDDKFTYMGVPIDRFSKEQIIKIAIDIYKKWMMANNIVNT